MQFVRLEIPTAPVTATLKTPPEVGEILKRACYDCHSNETQLRWFDEIVPAYWRVADHVKRGRSVLNFSEWDKLTAGDQKAKVWEAVNQVMLGAMPLSDYLFVHPAAKVSERDLAILKNYLLKTVRPVNPDTTKQRETAEQFAAWRSGTLIPPAGAVALNGVAFMPDYKNWKPLSTSERFDNGTIRIILGNEIAVKAVADSAIHPWPKGSAFAKVSWSAVSDTLGIVHPGAFIQVEFMIKDAERYASTGGWGFARFKTPKMVPYGKTAAFADECIRCHQPMKEEDFVFTQPIKQ